jgi:hypothetical protein
VATLNKGEFSATTSFILSGTKFNTVLITLIRSQVCHPPGLALFFFALGVCRNRLRRVDFSQLDQVEGFSAASVVVIYPPASFQ